METTAPQQSSALQDIQLSDYELERGKPMPSKNHSRNQLKLSSHFALRYGKDYSLLSEISVQQHNNKATPDLAVFSLMEFDWQTDETTLAEPPLTTIEILSPTQVLEDLLDKTEDYFSNGVKSCWIVLPRLTTILVMQANRSKTYFQIGDMLSDPSSGIMLQVSDIFE